MRASLSGRAGARTPLSRAADAVGTLALLGCLGAGSAYQQAPMRSTHRPEKADKDGEEQPLINKAESRV